MSISNMTDILNELWDRCGIEETWFSWLDCSNGCSGFFYDPYENALVWDDCSASLDLRNEEGSFYFEVELPAPCEIDDELYIAPDCFYETMWNLDPVNADRPFPGDDDLSDQARRVFDARGPMYLLADADKSRDRILDTWREEIEEAFSNAAR